MLTTIGKGRITADIIPQKSTKTGIEYVKFNLAVKKGYGEKQRTIFLQCSIFDEQQVQRIVNANIKKGGLIEFVGDLDVDEYEKDDKKYTTVKVKLYEWAYIAPAGEKPKEENAAAPNQTEPKTDELVDDDDIPF